MSRPELLDEGVLDEWLERHPTWRREDDRLVRELRTSDYAGAVAIAQAQVPLAEGLDHHPILTVGYRELRVELWTHDRGGLTHLDLDYAQGFDAIVGERFADAVV